MELYYFEPSPPCRAVLLFVHALRLKPTLKRIDILKGEHLTSQYIKLNPQHTLPLIVDDGYVLSESRAILVYLAEQYGQDSSFYPDNPKARGVINQRLMFDIGTLYHGFFDAYMKIDADDEPNRLDTTDKLLKLKEGFEFLELFMGDSLWMAGDVITIADYSLVATVSSAEACGFDLSDYEKVSAWLGRCKEEMLDYEEINQKGADLLRNILGKNLENLDEIDCSEV